MLLVVACAAIWRRMVAPAATMWTDCDPVQTLSPDRIVGMAKAASTVRKQEDGDEDVSQLATIGVAGVLGIDNRGIHFADLLEQPHRAELARFRYMQRHGRDLRRLYYLVGAFALLLIANVVGSLVLRYTGLWTLDERYQRVVTVISALMTVFITWRVQLMRRGSDARITLFEVLLDRGPHETTNGR